MVRRIGVSGPTAFEVGGRRLPVAACSVASACFACARARKRWGLLGDWVGGAGGGDCCGGAVGLWWVGGWAGVCEGLKCSPLGQGVRPAGRRADPLFGRKALGGWPSILRRGFSGLMGSGGVMFNMRNPSRASARLPRKSACFSARPVGRRLACRKRGQGICDNWRRFSEWPPVRVVCSQPALSRSGGRPPQPHKIHLDAGFSIGGGRLTGPSSSFGWPLGRGVLLACGGLQARRPVDILLFFLEQQRGLL